MSPKYCVRIFAGAVWFFFLATSGLAFEPNRTELALPITDQKRVVAHYMPGDTFCKSEEPADSVNPAYYSLGGAAARLGGLVQAVPMAALLKADVSLEEAVEHEIRAAQMMGVDGFQFFYPYSSAALLKKYNRIIAAFFKVAAEKFPEFRLTLCLCCGECSEDQEIAIRKWGGSIRELLAVCGDSPVWLKTPDGRHLFYTWCPDGLVGRISTHTEVQRNVALVRDTADAYEELAQYCGIRVAYIYHLRWHTQPGMLDTVLDYFPAVWGWTDSYAPADGWKEVAERCRRRQRTYTQTVYPDYYTSKIYNSDTGDMVRRLNDIIATPHEKLLRETQNCGVTYVYRNLLQRAVDLDVPLINFATWNDYAEGHHLAPEINHNFAFAVLLNHYKRCWLGLPAEDEWAAVFYKKYKSDITPKPFAFNLRYKEKAAQSEDVIELMIWLKEPAELKLNGQPVGNASEGLQVKRVPLRAGPVKLDVERDNASVLTVEGREWITDKPYRTDRLTYGYSSEFDHYFTGLFGNARPPVSDEYRCDEQGNPAWEHRIKK